MAPLQAKTHDHYIKVAERFFNLFGLPAASRTAKNIESALQEAAKDRKGKHRADGPLEDKNVIEKIRQYGYAKTSWQQLKTAVRYHLEFHGEQDTSKALAHVDMGLTKANMRRPNPMVKTITGDQMRSLLAEFSRRNAKNLNSDSKYRYEIQSNEDEALLHTIKILYITGCRPVEILTMRCLDDGEVFIESAKKSQAMSSDRGDQGPGDKPHDRGIDRTLRFPDHHHQNIKSSLQRLHSLGWIPWDVDEPVSVENLESLRMAFISKLDKARHRLGDISRRALELEKGICFYTFRHQLGSDLKTDEDKSRLEAAYILGHRATGSLDDYGYKKHGSSQRKIEITNKDELDCIRETHKSTHICNKPQRNQI